jgi:hypothetical protein
LIYRKSFLIYIIVNTNVCTLPGFSKFRKNVKGYLKFSLPDYKRVQKLTRLQFHTLLDLFTRSYFAIIYIYGHKLHPMLYHFTRNEIFFPFMWPCIVTNFFVIKPTRWTNFTNLFCHETLHVSDSSSVHHQEFIHSTLSNGICHRDL